MYRGLGYRRMSIYNDIRRLKENSDYTRDDLANITCKIEEVLTAERMWYTAWERLGNKELIDLLEYIAREHNI